MKLQTLEQFESKDPCECGGNCGCGGKPVNEKFSFSEDQVKDVAELIAKAIAKVDKSKTAVHDMEYDAGRGAGFDISMDGMNYEGGSYVVRPNGEVYNAAIGNSFPNAVYAKIGDTDIKKVMKNIKKFESVVKESQVTEKIKITKDEWPTIKFKDGSKTYEVEFDDYEEVDDHGNEGMDVYFIGKDQNGDEWAIDVSVEANYDNSGNIQDIYYDTLARMDESKINEAKKYKFKELAKAWDYVYGEDMEDEYEGFYQEVIGKHKNKVTKSDVAEIWSNVYGEDVADEYGGFFDSLKENVNQAIKLEAFNNIEEANSDGTISDDEDERRAELLERVKEQMQQLLASAEFDAKDIGGSFRSPGIMAEIKKELNNQLKKFR
jgi:hypothetical protein